MSESSPKPLILVVDDNDEIRSMVVAHLEGMQCDVIEANNGEDGLAMILANKPDLVLLDVMMPGLNGWEVAKYIKEKPELDNIGVIMVTAIGEQVNDMTSPLYGADDHIDKPFQFSELSFKIRRTLSKKKRQSQSPEQSSENT